MTIVTCTSGDVTSFLHVTSDVSDGRRHMMFAFQAFPTVFSTAVKKAGWEGLGTRQ